MSTLTQTEQVTHPVRDLHPGANAASTDIQLGEQGDSTNTGSSPSPQHHGARSKLQISVAMLSLCACVFAAALEVTIVTTAMPAIAAHFKSPSGYTWIGTGFILAQTASTPSWGKISDIWGRKPILLWACAIFFVGSLMCALVDDFATFILSRAIQGLGAAGMQSTVNICIGDMFSQRDRGFYYGLTSLVWAVACAVGPVMGGVFASTLTWRWCFWINLPIIGAAFVLLIFTLQLPASDLSVLAGLKVIDWTGSLFVVGSSVMLLLGLYLGGVYEPWHSATVVCLLVFGGATAGLFVLNEFKFAAYPIMPARLFNSRSSIAAYAVNFLQAFVFLGLGYYLPMYFQAVLMASPIRAGVLILPFVLSISITAAMTGLYIQMSGKYMPAMYAGLALMTLGVGLHIDSGLGLHWARIICFQLICGVGVGMTFEGTLLAAQTAVSQDDLAASTAAMSFTRALATGISVVIGGVVFQNRMNAQSDQLTQSLGPETANLFDGSNAAANIDLIKQLSPEQQLTARGAYLNAIKTMWITYAAFSALAFVLGFLIRQNHLKTEAETARVGLGAPASPAEGQTMALQERGRA